MLFRSDCHFDFLVELGVLIVLKLEIVYGEIVEIFDVLVHLESRGGILRIVENLLDNGDMAVIDVRVAYYVYEFTDFEIAHLREHMQQDRILHDVPVVCGEGVLTALIENAVEFVAGDVESHRIGARVEMHLVQILKVVDVGEDASGLRIVFEVKKHSVHLVEFALGIYALFAELIAVRFAYRACFVRPAVPDVRVEVVHVVALFLPNPENFVYCGLERRATQRDDGKLF